MSNLKIGFGRADITPINGLYMAGYPTVRRGDGCLDDLSASCIAVSDGSTTAVVFTIDNIGITQLRGDELRRTVAERVGLPYEAVFYACTHIHTAPSIHGGFFPVDHEYNSIFYRSLADIAVQAIADLSEAELYGNKGEVNGISFIRRYKMKDGSTRTNPGIKNPEIDHPIGEPDEQLQLVRIVREGKDDLVLLNFQCHPDVIGGTKYSSDWPGWVRRSFEGAVPGTKCLFFNGCQGDTNHINTDTDDPRMGKGYTHSRHMGLCVAGEAVKLYTYAEKIEGDKAAFIQHNIEVPSNRPKPEDIPTAEKYIAAHEAGRREDIPYSGMEYTTAVYEAYRMKKLENGPDYFTLYLNAVRLGGVVITGLPGEPFTEIGRSIKAQSPCDYTIVCCCANGYEAYYPTKEAYDEGGYEARSSEFKAGIAERLIEGSVEMLKSIY